MRRYKYEGPIIQFGQILCEKIELYTQAKTKEKAMSNLKFQAKKRLQLLPGAKINLLRESLIEL